MGEYLISCDIKLNDAPTAAQEHFTYFRDGIGNLDDEMLVPAPLPGERSANNVPNQGISSSNAAASTSTTTNLGPVNGDDTTAHGSGGDGTAVVNGEVGGRHDEQVVDGEVNDQDHEMADI